MENYKLETEPGDYFEDVAKRAKDIATAMHDNPSFIVEFNFNDIKCFVNKDTNPNYLNRDYNNAHLMDWETVGPNCVKEYTSEESWELNRRKKQAEIQAQKREEEWRIKNAKEREAVEKKIKDIEIDLSDAEGWNESRKANTDGYGMAALDYAEVWAKLMQIEISKGKTIIECYDYTQKGLGFLGISGFQFGCAVSILAQTWKYGEDLRKAHNKKYGVSEHAI